MRRYRSVIMVDVWSNTKEEAEKKSLDIVLGIPNSFLETTSELEHGSDISLIPTEPKNS